MELGIQDICIHDEMSKRMSCDLVAEGWVWRHMPDESMSSVPLMAAASLNKSGNGTWTMVQRFLNLGRTSISKHPSDIVVNGWMHCWMVVDHTEMLIYNDPLDEEPIEHILMPGRFVRAQPIHDEITLSDEDVYGFKVAMDLKIRLHRQVSAFELIKGSRLIEIVEPSNEPAPEYTFAVDSDLIRSQWISRFEWIRSAF
jgi:hypothetical protein